MDPPCFELPHSFPFQKLKSPPFFSSDVNQIKYRKFWGTRICTACTVCSKGLFPCVLENVLLSVQFEMCCFTKTVAAKVCGRRGDTASAVVETYNFSSSFFWWKQIFWWIKTSSQSSVDAIVYCWIANSWIARITNTARRVSQNC